MPLIERPLVKGGPVRRTRQHLWRGGHDPAMVRKALTITLDEQLSADRQERVFTLTLVNTGAAHFVPTGTPDRHLTVVLRVLDAEGNTIEEQNHKLIRTLMWRPFIVDLWDTRLPRWEPREYSITLPADSKEGPAVVEARVRYHLLAEERRRLIGYDNKDPISYEVFAQRIELSGNGAPRVQSSGYGDRLISPVGEEER
jgi:hypothetical protein